MGADRGKSSVEQAEKLFILRLVRPESEDTAGMELLGKSTQPFRWLEGCVSRLDQVTRWVIARRSHGRQLSPVHSAV